MLSTLIALSSLTFAQASGVANGGQRESIFPKPEARNPEVLRDRTIFQYPSKVDPKLGPFTQRIEDWSNLSARPVKSDAVKLRVLMLVFERDFVNPSFENTLELTDKQRLIITMSRLRTFFVAASDGNLDVEVIPRFIPEPIFIASEGEEIINREFNKFKFDADDREERGPFVATLVISSSDRSIPGATSFYQLGGCEPGFGLEMNLAQRISWELGNHLNKRFVDPQAGWQHPLYITQFRTDTSPRLFDPTFREDVGSVANGAPNEPKGFSSTWRNDVATVVGPVEVAKIDDALVYTESSILRAGGIAVPYLESGTLEFKVRTKSKNPLMLVGIRKEVDGVATSGNVTIGESGELRVVPDGSWQTVRLAASAFRRIECPTEARGRSRNPNEVIRYEFKDFRVVNESATPLQKQPMWDFSSSTGLAAALSERTTQLKRAALVQILSSPAKYKALQPKLLEMSTELEPAVSFGAVQAYGKIGIANDDLIGKAFMNRLVATAPNEYAREAALLYFAEHPEQTTFEAIAPNIVRRSWRTRIATVKALAALDRTDLKAKPAARQLLLTATGQDMAIIRSAALAAMKPEVELERKQLEYSLVNDPSEQVRLQCLKQLAVANAPKEVLFGSLADDSPYVREHVYEQLPANLHRETLQRMVIDRDTYVRAAALYGFAKLPDPTQSGEIQNTFAEEHPAVLLALVEGAQRGKWKLPSSVIENAKKSKSPLVREGVAKLPAQ